MTVYDSTPQPPVDPPSLPPPHPGPAAYQPQPPGRRGGAGKTVVIVILLVLLALSAFVNVNLVGLIFAKAGPDDMDTQVLRDGDDDELIACYGIEGIIDERAVENFERFYRKAIDDDAKAVVLRVVSPGGGVGPADRINEIVKRFKQVGLPVVVSMGQIAASGGYYVSASADEIVAEPTTVTGSIGVLAGWLVLKGTLEKLGAEMVVIKSTNAQGWKGEMSSFESPDPRHLSHLQEILDAIQARFEQVVADGRGDRLVTRRLPPYTVQMGTGQAAKTVAVREIEPFNGKVYLAAEAKRLGLIDRIGYHSEAIEVARQLAGLDHPKVVKYSPSMGFWSRLLRARSRAEGLILDRRTLENLRVPKLQMIWRID